MLLLRAKSGAMINAYSVAFCQDRRLWLFINIIVQSILNIKTMGWQDDLVGKGTCHQT